MFTSWEIDTSNPSFQRQYLIEGFEDSGSQVAVVTFSLVKKLKAEAFINKKDPTLVETAAEHKILTLGTILSPLVLLNIEKPVKAHVRDDLNDSFKLSLHFRLDRFSFMRYG